MNHDTIPAEIQALAQWLVWRYEARQRKGSKRREARQGKRTKVPYCAFDISRHASSTDPATWSTFTKALAAFQANSSTIDGVGFVLTEGDPFTGIDIDGCIAADGTIAPEALEIVRLLDSYSELSPSGLGLRIFVRAHFLNPKTGTLGAAVTPSWCRKIEIYSGDRYLTLTGNHLADTPTTIEERQAQLDEITAKLWPKQKRAPSRKQPQQGELTDDDLLEKARRAKNNVKFSKLFDHGDIADYAGDDSRADLALCSLLAFWAGEDPDRIDRLFRRSKLYREKWERQDYRDATIKRAIEACKGNFHSRTRTTSIDGRPRIRYEPKNLGMATRRAEQVLCELPTAALFERASCLCQVVPQRHITETLPSGDERSRDLEPDEVAAPGSCVAQRYVIRPIRLAPFTCLLSDAMVFESPDAHGNIRERGVPGAVAHALHEMEHWSLPVLEGVSEIPMLRDDGSVHSVHGYDSRTGYYLACDHTFTIPAAPTLGDAQQAARFLCDEMFQDFPFVRPCHLSAALALLLSFAARPCFMPGHKDENIPAFMCTAPIRGSGKTLLFKAIFAGLFGQMPFISLVPHTKEEWGKALLALALEGAAAILWDNVESGTAFGSPHLDAVLTSGSVSGRILGVSRTGRATTNAIHMISGNNLRLKGDMPRRTIPIRQDARKERPELRSGFRHADLVQWAMEHQREVVVAAFTILRAHALAGFPKHGMKVLGGFSKWDRVVRSPLLWLEYADPCEGMKDVHDHDDDDTADRREVLEALQDNFGDSWFDSKQLYAMAIAGKDQVPQGIGGPKPALSPQARLYNALLPDNGKRLSPGGLGKRLAGLANAPAGGLVLRRDEDCDQNKAMWGVEEWDEGSTAPVSSQGLPHGDAEGTAF